MGNNKVYILLEGCYNEQYVVGVFSDKEKAEEIEATNRSEYSVIERELDIIIPNKNKRYSILLDKDGNVIESAKILYPGYIEKDINMKEYNKKCEDKFYFFDCYLHSTEGTLLDIVKVCKNEDEAIEYAKDVYRSVIEYRIEWGNNDQLEWVSNFYNRE